MNKRVALVLVTAALTTVGLVAAPQAAAYTFGWSACANPTSTTCSATATVPDTICTPTTTTPCVVYDKSASSASGGACDATDHADIPVRAFRFKNSAASPEYRVQLTSGTSGNVTASAQPDGNRRLIGPGLESVKRENDPSQPTGEFRGCSDNVVLSSHRNQAPSSFDNYEWLDSPYFVEDSPGLGSVFGIVHNEFHGELADPATNCPPPLVLKDCWYSSITLATAAFSQQPSIVNKVGASYAHPTGSKLIASIPYQYDPPAQEGDWGREGYVAPTNVIRARLPGQPASEPDYYYMLSQISEPHGAQQYGVCVLRTNDLSDPDSWRAWGGYQPGWNVDLVNPYPSAPANPGDHVCKPVSPATLTTMNPRDLLWNRYLNKFMVIGNNGGLMYSLSDDLINWSEQQVLMTNGPTAPGACTEGGSYGTLLDKTDPANPGNPSPILADEPVVTPNLDHPGRNPYLFFTRPNTGACQQVTLDRDIVRVPIRLEQRRSILDGGITGTDDSYDSTAIGPSGSPNSFVSGTGGDYENEGTIRHAAATTNIVDALSPRWAYGTLNLKGGNLDDGKSFWFGSAFFLPADANNCANDFLCENSNVDIMRWESTGFFSGIRLKQNPNPPSTGHDRFHLVRGSGQVGTVSTDLGDANGFALPTGRTFWLEVHQELSNTDASALNEVYVDGRLVLSTRIANRGAETSGPSPTHLTDTSPVTKVKYGFVHNGSPVGTNSSMALDSSSIAGGQLGALGASATPTGLRTAGSTNVSIGVVANAAAGDATHPTPSGYRWHRRVAGSSGTWQTVAETAIPTFVDTGVSCTVQDYQYRVTTYTQPVSNSPEIDKKESVPSAPISASTLAC
jgi:hypothetical protein